MNLIQHIEQRGINIQSALRAGMEVSESVRNSDYSQSMFSAMIAELVNKTVETTSRDHASLVYRYIVQEAVRMHLTGQPVTTEAVLAIALQKSDDFMTKNPWVFAKVEGTAATEVDFDINKPEEIQLVKREDGGKSKKGAKQIAAKAIYEANKDKSNAEIIALFIKQLNMSKAGSTTYLYNMKKAAGVQMGKKGRKAKAE